MDKQSQQQPLSAEFFEQVMEEFSEDQKSGTQALTDLVTAVNGLTGQVQQLKEQVTKVPAPKTERSGIAEEQIMKDIKHIQQQLSGQQEQRTRKFQILLFPEQDRKLFYKIVFGRWLIMLVVMLLINRLYQWSIHYTDTNAKIKYEQLENDRVNKAWRQLYQQGNKNTKRLMEEVYRDAGEK